jgi:hypothetical protein
MSIPPSKTQSAVVNNLMDHHDMSITSFMSQLSAENKLINREIAFCMTQPTVVNKLMNFRDFQENYLGKIIVSNSEDKIKIHAILADESKSLFKNYWMRYKGYLSKGFIGNYDPFLSQ